MLNLPMKEVPNFIDYGQGWFRRMHNWFYRRGYDMYITTWKEEVHNKNKYYIVGGQSPRFKNCGHAVIFKGDKPYWDVHPDGTFIVGDPTHVYIIKKSNKAKYWLK